MAKRTHETVSGQKIMVYDNGGRSYDRYTVVFLDHYISVAGVPVEYMCLGMSASPCSPLGFGQHGAAVPGDHIGKRILFAELPEECQRLVQRDLDA